MKKIQKWIVALSTFLLAFIMCGISTVHADTVDRTAVYTVTSTGVVNTSGILPESSSCTFATTNTNNNNKNQLTAGNSMTFTLNEYNGITIKSITLSMKSNSKTGEGSLKITNGTVDSYLVGSAESTSKFNTADWNGAWSTSYVNITKTPSTPWAVPDEGDFVVTIAATENSLYCERLSVTYEEEVGSVVNVTGITLDQSSATMETKNTLTLTSTVSPENATNKNVTWTSSNEAVATVSNGTVTSIAEGTTTITAKTQDGNFTATCEVTVEDKIVTLFTNDAVIKKQLAFSYSYADDAGYTEVSTPAVDTDYYLGLFSDGRIAFGGSSNKTYNTAAKYQLKAAGTVGDVTYYYLHNTLDKKYLGNDGSGTSLSTATDSNVPTSDNYKWHYVDGRLTNNSANRYVGLSEKKDTLGAYANSNTSTNIPAKFYTGTATVNFTKMTARFSYTLSAKTYNRILAANSEATFGFIIKSSKIECPVVVNADGSATVTLSITNINSENFTTDMIVIPYTSYNDGSSAYTAGKSITTTVKKMANEYLTTLASDENVQQAYMPLSYIGSIM